MNEFDILLYTQAAPVAALPITYYASRWYLQKKGLDVQNLTAIIEGRKPTLDQVEETHLAGSSITCLVHKGYLLKSTYRISDEEITIVQKNNPARFLNLLNGAAAQLYIREVVGERCVPNVVDISSRLGILSEYVDCSTPLGDPLLPASDRMTAARKAIDKLIRISRGERGVPQCGGLTFSDYFLSLGSYFTKPRHVERKVFRYHRYYNSQKLSPRAEKLATKASHNVYNPIDILTDLFGRSKWNWDDLAAITTDHWTKRYSTQFQQAHWREIGCDLRFSEFTHGDPNPYNFLVGHGEPSRVTILDWDKAGHKDLLLDLFLVAHASSLYAEEESKLKEYALREYTSAFGLPTHDRFYAIEKEVSLYTLHKISTLLDAVASSSAGADSSRNPVESLRKQSIGNLERIFAWTYNTLMNELGGALADEVQHVFASRVERISRDSLPHYGSYGGLQMWQDIATLQTPPDETAATRARKNVSTQIYSLASKRQAVELSFRVAGYTHFSMMFTIAPLFAEYGYDPTLLYKTGALALFAGLLVGGGARQVMDYLKPRR